MEFKRTKTGAAEGGSSLWFELPDVTNEQMRKLFGSGLASQDKCKYSTSLAVSYVNHYTYYFYKSYGVWRVGAHRDSSVSPEIAEKIKALFQK